MQYHFPPRKLTYLLGGLAGSRNNCIEPLLMHMGTKLQPLVREIAMKSGMDSCFFGELSEEEENVYIV